MNLSLTINQTLKWLSSLPILMQESFWWWQCSDRYIISVPPPPPHTVPKISLVVAPCLYTFTFRHKPYGFHQRRSHMSEDTWGQRPALCLAAGKGCPISPSSLHCISRRHYTTPFPHHPCSCISRRHHVTDADRWAYLAYTYPQVSLHARTNHINAFVPNSTDLSQLPYFKPK